ncbi:MAG: C4-dicarboxylate ABC transporter substrate-binding protein [Deltaproteobacteria bacterium HGW-Deltaproteobacteria-21]|nr:MAG: C4-dicarboxylate ABC transporter substrate-binding protein [Deltaproteobacteria bacterium HGW-Deltaproteobacteria-21]
MTRTRIACCLLALAFCLSGPLASNAQTTNYTLKIQTAVPSSSIYFKLIERMAGRVDAMSASRLKVEVLPAGAVVGAFEILDAVDKNIVNGGFAWTHYWSGKHPAGLLFSAPTAGLGIGLDQTSVMSWIYDGDGDKLYQQYFTDVLKFKVKGFLCMPMGPEPFGWFSKEVKSLDEVKKMKFRSPPGIPAESFKAIGMPTVSMPGGEIVPSAQRGVIDAAEWISPADDAALGLNSVWKHYYIQGLHQAISIGDIYVNLDWWNKLPKDLQAIFNAGIMSLIADTMNWNVSQNSIALKKFVVENKVVVHDTPVDYFPAYMAASKEVVEKYAQKDAFFKKVLQSMTDWANVTVPYQSRCNGTYYQMGKNAMDQGLVGYQK